MNLFVQHPITIRAPTIVQGIFMGKHTWPIVSFVTAVLSAETIPLAAVQALLCLAQE